MQQDSYWPAAAGSGLCSIAGSATSEVALAASYSHCCTGHASHVQLRQSVLATTTAELLPPAAVVVLVPSGSMFAVFPPPNQAQLCTSAGVNAHAVVSSEPTPLSPNLTIVAAASLASLHPATVCMLND